MSHSDIQKKMVTGAGWMMALKLADNGLGLISTLILARLLLPSDFGAVAMAMSVIALLELMTAFRFDVVIIQRQTVNEDHLNTAWTFNVLFGVAVAVLMYVLAAPAAQFYKEPRLEAILHVLSFGWLAFGLENIGTVAFRKELQFHKEFVFSLSKRVAMFVVTVPLAFMLRNYWALVVGVIVGRFVSVVISFVIHPYRPRFSLVAVRDLFSFSSWLLLNNVLYFVNDRISNFVIGRISGTRALGAYTLAYEMSCMPTVDLIAPINRAVYPGYAKLANDKRLLNDAFVNTIGMMSLVAFPAGVGIAAVAEPLVRVALGAEWADAVPLVAILGLYGAVASLGTNTSYVFLALGLPRLLTVLAAGRAVLLVPLLIVASHWGGAIGAAWAILATELFYRPMTFLLALRSLAAPAKALLSQLWRPTVASVPMYFCVRWVQTVAFPSETTAFEAARLASGVITGVAVYVGLILLLWRLSGTKDGPEAFVLRRCRALLRRSTMVQLTP